MGTSILYLQIILTRASVRVAIKFSDYDNTGGLAYNGRCCDVNGDGPCGPDLCDYQFAVCLDDR